MTNHLYQNDLPDGLDLGPMVAIDCETMGLNPHRDRLCVVQLSGGDGHAHIVQIAKDQTAAPNLCKLLEDPDVLKLFHYGRFDIAAMYNAFGALTAPVYCTKIASKLVRTYTDRHGLKNLLQELIQQDISKQQQSSDWARRTDQGATGLCGLGWSLSAQAQGGTGPDAAARRPQRCGAGLFRFPANPGQAGSGGLA